MDSKRVWRATAAALVLATMPIAADVGLLDRAGVFSADSVKSAKIKMGEIAQSRRFEVYLETFAELPAEKKAEYAKLSAAEQDRFLSKWSEERAEANRVKGLYILICQSPSKLKFASKKRLVSDSVVEQTSSAMLTELRKKDFDGALTAGLKVLQSAPSPTDGGKTNNRSAVANPQAANPRAEGGGDIWGIVLAIGGVVLVVWVVSALLRAMSSGGGGGFMPSLLGGLFGGMAGMWMYNSFFGGNSSWGDSSGGTGGDDGWSHSGGGDFGGGGGDFGGGGGGDF